MSDHRRTHTAGTIKLAADDLGSSTKRIKVHVYILIRTEGRISIDQVTLFMLAGLSGYYSTLLLPLSIV